MIQRQKSMFQKWGIQEVALSFEIPKQVTTEGLGESDKISCTFYYQILLLLKPRLHEVITDEEKPEQMVIGGETGDGD